MSLDVTGPSFQRDVLDQSHRVPVVVDFWAPWCGPCRTLGPVLERLEAEGAGSWVLAKLNTDDHQALAQQFEIRGIPAVKAFWKGKVVEEFVGAVPEPQVREFLKKVVPDEAAMRASEAVEALRGGDPARASALFEAALVGDPAQPEALLHLARQAMEAGEGEAAKGYLTRLRPRDRMALAGRIASLEFGLHAPPMAAARAAVDASPEDPQARYSLGCALVAAGDAAEALEIFLGLVKRNRSFGEDAGRKAMLQVFDIVGARSSLADEYRRRLSLELFR